MRKKLLQTIDQSIDWKKKQINWNQVSQTMGMSKNVCKVQYQNVCSKMLEQFTVKQHYQLASLAYYYSRDNDFILQMFGKNIYKCQLLNGIQRVERHRKELREKVHKAFAKQLNRKQLLSLINQIKGILKFYIENGEIKHLGPLQIQLPKDNIILSPIESIYFVKVQRELQNNLDSIIFLQDELQKIYEQIKK